MKEEKTKDADNREFGSEVCGVSNDSIDSVAPEAEDAASAALEQKTREAAENYEKFLRVCAELDNYKKRAERERAESVGFANENIITEVLPVMDNLERALSHVGDPGTSSDSLTSLIEGVRLTINQTYAVLAKFGLEEIKSVGQKFDPAAHHAISHEETAEMDEGMVVREFQKGYTLKGRLLRASMVAVSKKPSAGAASK